MFEEILYQGDLFQVVRRKKKHAVTINEDIKYIDIDYELIKRPPGVRAIILHDDKILLNKEYRYELKSWDYRLPGGKVFDSQMEFQKYANSDKFLNHIEKALVREIFEETNINVKSYQLYECSHNGFTVEWDLYYYIVDKFEVAIHGNSADIKQRNEYEYTQCCWVDYSKALQYCIEKKVSEDRSAGVIMRFLLSKINIRNGGNNLYE